MKKAIATSACLLAIAAVFAGCNTNDGKVNDNSTVSRVSTASRINETDRNNALTASERRAVENNDTAVSAANRPKNRTKSRKRTRKSPEAS